MIGPIYARPTRSSAPCLRLTQSRASLSWSVTRSAIKRLCDEFGYRIIPVHGKQARSRNKLVLSSSWTAGLHLELFLRNFSRKGCS